MTNKTIIIALLSTALLFAGMSGSYAASDTKHKHKASDKIAAAPAKTDTKTDTKAEVTPTPALAPAAAPAASDAETATPEPTAAVTPAAPAVSPAPAPAPVEAVPAEEKKGGVKAFLKGLFGKKDKTADTAATTGTATPAAVKSASAPTKTLAKDGKYNAECIVPATGTVLGRVEVSGGKDPSGEKEIDVKNPNNGKITKVTLATSNCTFTPVAP